MNESQTHPLPNDLRIRAEHFFDADLSAFTFEISSIPERFGSLAVTKNGEIFISPEVFNLSGKKIDEIFAHELAHVMQFRSGCVSGSVRTVRDDAIKYDLLMEKQAIAFGIAFSQGLEKISDHILPKYKNSSPDQTYILLENRVLNSTEALSESANIVLGLIKNGNEWFDWAVNQEKHGYSFTDESQLVEGIQFGLYGNSLLFIPHPELIVNPSRLMALSSENLTLLGKELNKIEDNTIVDLSVSKMLAANGLRVKSELDIGIQFLSQMGVSDAGIFQAMTVSDLIMLFNLVNDASTSTSLDTASQKEAAQFAVQNAGSTAEFIDIYIFYISLADKLIGKSKSAEKRIALAEQYLEEITSVLFNSGLCPIVDQGLTPIELRSIVQNWVDGGQCVGFGSLSRGASQIMQGTEIGIPGKSIVVTEAAENYQAAAQKFIKSNEAKSVTLSQDGQLHIYTLKNKNGFAELEVNQQGFLTIAKYLVS